MTVIYVTLALTSSKIQTRLGYNSFRYKYLDFLDKLCAGVLHKMDDFLDAAYLAVKSDRTLVSYVPGVEYRHMRDNNNNRVRNKTKKRGRVFFHGWTWGDMLDTKQFVYEKFDQVTKNCLTIDQSFFTVMNISVLKSFLFQLLNY